MPENRCRHEQHATTAISARIRAKTGAAMAQLMSLLVQNAILVVFAASFAARLPISSLC